jgi:hypothetical protein
MGNGNFYKEIPWEGFAEIPGEYRHEKGVPQQGGADNNWNSPLHAVPTPDLGWYFGTNKTLAGL